MQKTLTIAFIIGSLFIFFDVANVWSSLFMFLLVGAVPGTNIIASPAFMLEAISLIVGFVLARIAVAPVRSLLSRPARARHAVIG